MTARSKYEIPRQWLPFVGSKLGLAKRLYSLATDPDDADLHHVFPAMSDIGRLLTHPNAVDARAGGAGATSEEAANCAMGELVERYAAFAYDGAGRLVLSYAELMARGHRSAPFELLQPFDDEQYRSPGFPYAAFTPETRVGWLEGTNLLDGRPTYLPGQMVALGYRRAPEETAPCLYPTSSGSALATSVEGAVAKGLLEAIERDAIMVRWYARLPPPRLDLDAADLFDRSIVGGARNLEITFHDLTVDGDIPVVCVTCIERTGRPCYFVLGAAAALDISSAARKAFVEAGQSRPFVKTMMAIEQVPAGDLVFDDFEANLRFHAAAANARFVEWFVADRTLSTRRFPRTAHLRTASKSLACLLNRCADATLTPIAFDMTTPEIRDAGLFACRVIVPELVPLCVPSAPFLGHPRLADFIGRYKPANGGIPDWVPHPFP
jgi:ribosomal protein S12 methylthiotransferase accessory factor